jgi:hypothetical protein
MMIDLNQTSSSEWLFPIRDHLDRELHLTEKSDVHSAKPYSPRTSAVAGLRISIKPFYEKIQIQRTRISTLMKPVSENSSLLVCSNLDPLSETTSFFLL